MSPERSLTAAMLILGYAAIIGFTDNFVRQIAAEAGLWQFHLTRTAMAMALLALAAPLLGLSPRPKRPVAVAARSLIHGTAMVIYFGALAFLPVALVAAGLFTAPIFVLLIGRFVLGEPVGALRALAVATGFLGVLLVLGPHALSGSGLSLAALLPVLAGGLYATGHIVTRRWCGGERPETLLAGFFLALGFFGAVGLCLLALWPMPVSDGAEGFVLRGWVRPSAGFLGWTFVQAAGSLVGVGLMIRAYQLADAGRVSVMEYVILPASAFWTWAIWGETLGWTAWAGMALIACAGTMIALGGRAAPGRPGDAESQAGSAVRSPTASRQ